MPARKLAGRTIFDVDILLKRLILSSQFLGCLQWSARLRRHANQATCTAVLGCIMKLRRFRRIQFLHLAEFQDITGRLITIMFLGFLWAGGVGGGGLGAHGVRRSPARGSAPGADHWDYRIVGPGACPKPRHWTSVIETGEPPSISIWPILW